MEKVSLDSYETMAIDYADHVDNKPWNADYERPAAMKLVGEVEGEESREEEAPPLCLHPCAWVVGIVVGKRYTIYLESPFAYLILLYLLW